MVMGSIQYHLQEGVSIAESAAKKHVDILSPAALQFIVMLEREFGERQRALLKKRQEHQSELTIGKMPNFSRATENIRTSYWKAAPLPYPLLDRRVEQVGPPDARTIVDGMNSNANVFIADFEDTFSPTWENVIQAHSNIHDAVHGSLLYIDDEGKQQPIVQNNVTLMVRPRGWHAIEKHIMLDSRPISASLFDFGLTVFHNTHELRSQGKGPYFYLPKVENRLEAKLWNDVFLMAQDELEVPHGTIKATVGIETFPAAFEIQEILFELREHCSGLHCHWWNYLFNFMMKVRHRQEYSLPSLSRLSPTTNFLHALSVLTIQTAHKRGVHALAGPTTQYPVTQDEPHNRALAIKIQADKAREVEEGFDGTWVLHPSALAPAKTAFDEVLNAPNQLHRKRDDVDVTEEDLLTVSRKEIEVEDLKNTVRTILEFFAGWLSGKGMMIQKDMVVTATEIEIARTQLWRWKHNTRTGRQESSVLSDDLYKKTVSEELKKLLSTERRKEIIPRLTTAKSILDRLVLDRNFTDFFSTIAYSYIE